MVKIGYKFKPLHHINKLSVDSVIECCATELVDQSMVIICIYRVPTTSKISLEIFYSVLDKILTLINSKKCKSVILCGDFNIDILKKNKTTTDFKHLLIGHNLYLEFRQPSRLQSNTCIDNFAHNKVKCQSKILDLGISDHTAQLLKCKVNKKSKLPHWRISRRDYNVDNLGKFRECLTSLKFSEIYKTEDPRGL